MSSGPLLVYFSSTSENTHRFVGKLGFPTARIPLRRTDPPLTVDEEYVLVVPTYGGGSVKGAVPKQVIAFLNNPDNRALCRGVIASGNTNFGQAYCLAGDIIASKLGGAVPVPLRAARHPPRTSHASKKDWKTFGRHADGHRL